MIEVETMPDLVHLVEVDPRFGIRRLVRASTVARSRLLRQKLGWLRSRLPTLWTSSYFVATVGGAPRSAITRYVEKQNGR